MRVRLFHIQRDAALAAIEPDEEAGLTKHRAVVAAREIAVAWPLDLDHISAHVGEMAAADRCRHRVLQRDDTHALQWLHDEVLLLRSPGLKKDRWRRGVKIRAALGWPPPIGGRGCRS